MLAAFVPSRRLWLLLLSAAGCCCCLLLAMAAQYELVLQYCVRVEANGAYGAATRDFFRVIERAVEAAAERDHYHWSAPSWREHWRQRVDVALAKGQAGLVSSAVKASRNRGKKQAAKQRRRNKASPEWSPTDCSPSAPQQG
jgi:hypothetical protein